MALTEHHQPHGALISDRLRQQVGDGAGHELAPVHLGEERDEIVGGDHHVAVAQPFEAAADRIAMDRADDHLVGEHHRPGDRLDAPDMVA